MPWEIEFKNLKLTRKRKKVEKGQMKGSKKSKGDGLLAVDFSLEILDRKEAIL